jgi:hypothetical protein
MAFASTFELQRADGTPADPPKLTAAAPLWRPGDTIPLGRRSLARDRGARRQRGRSDGAGRRGGPLHAGF